MKLIRYILIFSMMVASCSGIRGAETAKDFLKEASSILTSAKALKAEYSISGPDSPAQTGKLTAMGNKFAIAIGPNRIVYDGKTQWSVSSEMREINIYEPTLEEVLSINPFAVVKSYSKAKNVKSMSAPKGYRKIELTGFSSDSGIAKAIVTFNQSTKLPVAITLTLNDGQSLLISVTSIKINPEGVRSSQFKVTPSAYPGYEVVDLR